jgi:uncharacterized protein (DUF4415 family)
MRMSGESLPRGGQNPMSGGTIGKTSKSEHGTDWERLRTMSDAEIREAIESDPDIQPTDEEFWKETRVAYPRPKEVVTIRLDADLLEWFRKEKGYQTKINAILRAYMNAKIFEGSAK